MKIFRDFEYVRAHSGLLGRRKRVFAVKPICGAFGGEQGTAAGLVDCGQRAGSKMRIISVGRET